MPLLLGTHLEFVLLERENAALNFTVLDRKTVEEFMGNKALQEFLTRPFEPRVLNGDHVHRIAGDRPHAVGELITPEMAKEYSEERRKRTVLGPQLIIQYNAETRRLKITRGKRFVEKVDPKTGEITLVPDDWRRSYRRMLVSVKTYILPYISGMANGAWADMIANCGYHMDGAVIPLQTFEGGEDFAKAAVDLVEETFNKAFSMAQIKELVEKGQKIVGDKISAEQVTDSFSQDPHVLAGLRRIAGDPQLLNHWVDILRTQGAEATANSESTAAATAAAVAALAPAIAAERKGTAEKKGGVEAVATSSSPAAASSSLELTFSEAASALTGNPGGLSRGSDPQAGAPTDRSSASAAVAPTSDASAGAGVLPGDSKRHMKI